MGTWPPGAWKPKRNGAVYCSPACGAGCLYSEYRKAHEQAKALWRELGGKPFEVYVWENMGWHWRLSLGGESVHVHYHAPTARARESWWMVSLHGRRYWGYSSHSLDDALTKAARNLRADLDGTKLAAEAAEVAQGRVLHAKRHAAYLAGKAKKKGAGR